MPVPKRKRSRPRRDKRFANKGLPVTTITACSNCQEPLMPHAACKYCGFYKGIKVMTTKMDRVIKRTEKRKAKEDSKKQKQPPVVSEPEPQKQ